MKSTVIKMVFVAAVFAGSVSVFLYIAHELFGEKEYEFDNLALEFVKTHLLSPGVISAMTIITFFASANFLLIGYSCLGVYMLIQKRFVAALYILSTGLSGILVNLLLKWLFRRPRPADPLIGPLNDFSFPSGHSSAAFIFYGLLMYLIWWTRMRIGVKRLLSVLLFLFSIVIGISRIYLRVHYPTDVLAGFCVGAAWLSLSFVLYRGLFFFSHYQERDL